MNSQDEELLKAFHLMDRDERELHLEHFRCVVAGRSPKESPRLFLVGSDPGEAGSALRSGFR